MINATGNRMTGEIRRMSALSQDIAQTQVQVSSGKRIQRASDDPVGAARVANIRQSQADDAAWGDNLLHGTSLAAQADSVVKTVSDRLARARELGLAGANQTLSGPDRASIAVELRSIADEVDDLTATRDASGNPLFSPGNALKMRFGETAVFAPVPSAAEVFTSGSGSISQQIRYAATAVQNGSAAPIASALNALDAGINHVADAAADIGVRASRIDRLKDSHQARGIEFAAERSGLEDTDLSVAIARLNAQTITLEAAQGAFARINRRTLMDVLS
jgi:flagellar hook-associated protein 3 FlgL